MELPASDIYGFARAPPPTSAEDDSLRRGLDKALYKSQWALATRWLGENRLLVAEGEAALVALLQAGAKAFGHGRSRPRRSLLCSLQRVTIVLA